jgi:purine-nucleoside phosphorylase
MMENLTQQIDEMASLVRNRTKFRPKVAIILGSGLGDFAELLQDSDRIPAGELPGYPVSTVPGHKGRLVFGKLDGVEVAAIQGRVHYYEGHPLSIVTLPVRLLHALDVRVLIVTNASGGISRRLTPGDLMLIDDHVNLMGTTPLVGWIPTDEVNRFVDMGHAYSPELNHLAEEIALELGIPLKRGLLGVLTGPSYETPAEVRMQAILGCDAACMSTVPEVIVAKSLGMTVMGISCITNQAAGLSERPLNHEEVQEIAATVAPKFQNLIRTLIIRIAAEYLGN